MELEFARRSTARPAARQQSRSKRIGMSAITAAVLALGAAGAHAYDVTTSPYPVSYTHLTLPTTRTSCRSRWSPYH